MDLALLNLKFRDGSYVIPTSAVGFPMWNLIRYFIADPALIEERPTPRESPTGRRTIHREDLLDYVPNRRAEPITISALLLPTNIISLTLTKKKSN